MIENFSKPIQKTDDSAKQLIIEALVLFNASI